VHSKLFIRSAKVDFALSRFWPKEQFIRHVDLIIGMDEDFLSADFPK